MLAQGGKRIEAHRHLEKEEIGMQADHALVHSQYKGSGTADHGRDHIIAQGGKRIEAHRHLEQEEIGMQADHAPVHSPGKGGGTVGLNQKKLTQTKDNIDHEHVHVQESETVTVNVRNTGHDQLPGIVREHRILIQGWKGKEFHHPLEQGEEGMQADHALVHSPRIGGGTADHVHDRILAQGGKRIEAHRHLDKEEKGMQADHALVHSKGKGGGTAGHGHDLKHQDHRRVKSLFCQGFRLLLHQMVIILIMTVKMSTKCILNKRCKQKRTWPRMHLPTLCLNNNVTIVNYKLLTLSLIKM